MPVKIFAKFSYNIHGVASPSFIVASAWTDELNEMNSDTRKILSFFYSFDIPFFMPTGGGAMGNNINPNAIAHNFPVIKSLDELLAMFGLTDNEKYPFGDYMPTVGFIGDDTATEKLAIIMSNLAYDTARGVNTEPAEVFFYIHKLTTAEIDSFADSHPDLEPINASVTDLYDLLLPCVATKNDMFEADGYRQATQKGNAIVFYADCINYLSVMNNPPIARDMPK